MQTWGFVILFVMTVIWLVLRMVTKGGHKNFNPAQERVKVYHMIRELWDFVYSSDNPCDHPRIYPIQKRLDEYFARTKTLAISFDDEFITRYMGNADHALFITRAGLVAENLYTQEDKKELELWLAKENWQLFPLALYWKLIRGAFRNTCEISEEKTQLIKKLLPMMRILDLDEKMD